MKKRTTVALLSASLVATLSPSLAMAGPVTVAAPKSLDDQSHSQFIVKYKEGTQQSRALASLTRSDQALSSVGVAEQRATEKSAEDLGASVKTSHVSSEGRAVVVLDKTLSNEDSKTFVADLQSNPDVEYAEPDLIMRTTAKAPNDTHWEKMWNLKDERAGMGALKAWDVTKGKGVNVAVLDTGITKHPDLDGNVVAGYDFISDAATSRDNDGRDNDPSDEGDWARAGQCGGGEPKRDQSSSWHGTHVSGTIGAIANDKFGIPGVAPEAKIQPVRVLGLCGGRSSDITDGITWASGGSVPGVPKNATPAKVINMSLGGPSRSCPRAYQQAIDGAVSRGATVVVAAGNESRNVANFTPANCKNVVVVGATGADASQAYYSNFGKGIDLSAQGGDLRNNVGILSTVSSGKSTPGKPSWAYMQGTSMAAPHVAGVAALMTAANSKLTPAQIREMILETVKPMGTCKSGNGQCGKGLLDGGAAVAKAAGNKGSDDGSDDSDGGTDPGEPTEPDTPWWWPW